MGVLNVTPDSFSDGGRYLEPELAVRRALELIEAGADLIDIGGESTRPGAEPVAVEEEWRRVLPVISALRKQTQAILSIDTTKPEVARRALDQGADMVNDVSGLRAGGALAEVAARHGAALCLMHSKGTPRDMQKDPRYQDLLGEVRSFLTGAVARAEAAGARPDGILIDPGIGFGKTAEHNLRLLGRLEELAPVGKPILVGPSRKSFIGALLGRPVEERLMGTAAAVAAAIFAGCHVVRVHDVREMRDVARLADAVLNASAAGERRQP
jgi:dihydropteroate synthase